MQGLGRFTPSISITLYCCVLLFASQTHATAAHNQVIFDFEEFSLGQIIDDEYRDQGLTIEAENFSKGPDVAVIFDTNYPTGGDKDLKKPFRKAYRSKLAKKKAKPGNVLILHENHTCDAQFCSDPDDEGSRPAGLFHFTFDSPVNISRLDVFDIEHRRKKHYPLTLFDVSGNVIRTLNLPHTGNRRWDRLLIDEQQVAKMTIRMDGSGAIDNLVIENSLPVNLPPEISSEPPVSIFVSDGLQYDVDAFDPEGGNVEFFLEMGPQGSTIDPSSGLLTWITDDSNLGEHVFRVSVRDELQNVSYQHFVVDVVPNGNVITIDFEEYGKGRIIDDEYVDRYGLRIVTTNFSTGPNVSVLFDSENPTGGDYDLAQPFKAYSGNADQNPLNPGKILIIQENHTCDADYCQNPDDEGSRPAGKVELRFEEPVFFVGLDAFDVEYTSYKKYPVKLLNEDGDIISIKNLPNTGDNRWGTLEVNQAGVSTVRLYIDGSSAIDNLRFISAANNQAPIIYTSPVFHVNENETYQYAVGANDPDGDSLVYSLINQPQGMTIDPASGNIEWVPGDEQTGEYTIQIEVSDGSLSAEQEFVLTVIPVNDAPVAHPATYLLPEDSSLNLVLSGSDIDSSDLVYTLARLPTYGTLAGTAPALVYTPGPDFNGTDQIEFSVSDGLLSSNLATITIEVSAENDAPIAESQSIETLEDTSVAVDVNASDVDSSALSYEIIQAPLNGTITGQLPNLVYTPNLDFNGSDSFTFQANDGQFDSNIASVDINILPINDVPVIRDLSLEINEDTPFTLGFEAEDPDGDTIVFSIITPPEFGTISDGVYTPNSDYFGSDQFSYVANDGTLDSDEKIATIQVLPVNDAPVISYGGVTEGVEGSALTIDIQASDIDGDELIFELVSAPLGALFDAETLTFSWTPDYDQAGESLVEISVSDGIVTTSVSFSLSIENTSRAPVITSIAPIYAQETVLYEYAVQATDDDGDELSFSLLQSTTGMTISSETGLIQWTPDFEDAGVYTVEVQVADTSGLTVSQSYELNVTNLNRAPSISSVANETATENVAYVYAVEATDADGDALVFSLVSAPAGMTIEPTDGIITWLPSFDNAGTYPVNVQVQDGSGAVVNQEFTLTVIDVNRAPISFPESLTTNEDTPTPITLTGSDPDNDELSYLVTQSPVNGVLLGEAPNLTYSPNANFNGSDSFAYVVNDGSVSSSAATVSVTVNAVNDLPEITSSPAVSVNEGSLYSYPITATDIDGDVLSYTLVQGPTGVVVDSATGILTWTPGMEDAGTYTVEVGVTDGLSLATQRYNLVVLNVNQAPIIQSAALIYAEENSLYSYQVIANDPDGDDLFYTLLSAPTGMVIDETSGLITWTPTYDDSGLVEVSIRVSDVEGQIAEQIYALEVIDINRQPIAIDQSLSLNEDESLEIILTGSDADLDPLNFILLTPPANGSLVGELPNITYTPNTNFNGADSFSFTASDGIMDSVEAQIDLVIQGVNDAPTISYTGGNAGSEGELLQLQFTSADVDGDALTYSHGELPLGSNFDPNNGLFSWVPNFEQSGTYEIDVSVSDGIEVVTTTIPMTISNTNRAPSIISSAPASINVGETYAYSVEASDPDGDSLTFALLSAPAGMTLEASLGQISWTPDTNDLGENTVQLQVRDSGGLEAIQVFSIMVNEQINLPPEITSDAEVKATEGVNYSYSVDATDPNEDSLIYELLMAPSGMSIDSSTGELSWLPGEDYAGSILARNEACVYPIDARIAEFDPVTKWSWTTDVFGSTQRVSTIPVVGPLTDTNGDGIYDDQDIPTVVFTSGERVDLGLGTVKALNGSTGQQLWKFDDPAYSTLTTAPHAIGDLEGDGIPEVVGVLTNGGIVVLDNELNFKWSSPVPEISGYGYAGVTLADLDGDGTSEILYDDHIINSDQTIRAVLPFGSEIYTPVAVDINLDGFQEVLIGSRAYTHTGEDYWDNSDKDAGDIATINVDEDRYPEFAIVSTGTPGTLRVLDHDGSTMWQTFLPGSGGGAPLVADLNNDGLPEIGVATEKRYYVFNSQGQIQWTRGIVDNTSKSLGSTAFDFDGDGIVEVLIYDTERLRIFRGDNGKSVFSISNVSLTTREYPVVADVDGDGHAEILLPSYRPGGLRLIQDRNDTWRSTRKIWNQFAYSIDNITDGGSVPATPEFGWQAHNSFRQNAYPHGLTEAAADLTAKNFALNGSGDTYSLQFQIVNRGMGPTIAPTSVSVYAGDPTVSGILIGTESIPALSQDREFSVELSGIPKADLINDLYIQINQNEALVECDTDNNLVLLPLVELSVTDPDGASDYQLFLIDVTQGNEEPVIETSSIEEMSVSELNQQQIVASDPDKGDALMFSLSDGPSGMTINEVTGLLEWSPFFSQVGTHPLTVRVTDLNGLWTEQSYFVSAIDSLEADQHGVCGVLEIPESAQIRDLEYSADRKELYVLSTNGSNSNPIGSIFIIDQLTQTVVGEFPLAGAIPRNMEFDENSERLFISMSGEWNQYDSRIAIFDVASRQEVESIPMDYFSGSDWNYTRKIYLAPGSDLLANASNGDFNFRVVRLFDMNTRGLFDAQAFGSNRPHDVILSPDLFRAYTAVENNSDLHIWNMVSDEFEPVISTGMAGRINFMRISRDLKRLYLTNNSTDSRIAVIDIDPQSDSFQQVLRVAPVPNLSNRISSFEISGSGRYGYIASSAHGEALVIDMDPESPDYLSTTASFTVSGSVSKALFVHEPNLNAFLSTRSNEIQLICADAGTNNTPSISSAPITEATVDIGYVYNVEGTDIDGDGLFYSLDESPEGMSITTGRGEISWEPQEFHVGQHQVVIRLTDEYGAFTQQRYTLTVNANEAPSIVSSPVVSATEGTLYTYDVDATDPEGIPVTYQLSQSPSGMVIDMVSGMISWIPDESSLRNVDVTVEALDDVGGAASQTFTIVVAENFVPVANSQSVTVNEGDSISIELSGEDEGGQQIQYVLNSFPQNGSIIGSEPSLVYVPSPGFVGSDTFTFFVTDGSQTSNTATVSISVLDINQAPVIVSQPDSTTVRQGDAFNYAVIAEDSDGDNLNYQLSSTLIGANISESGALSVDTTSLEIGNYSLSVTVSDTQGASVDQDIEISVIGSGYNPLVIGSDPVLYASLLEGYLYRIEANYTGSQMTYSLVESPEGAYVSGNSLRWNGSPTHALNKDQKIEMCASLDDFIIGSYGTFSLYAESLHRPERFPKIFKQISPTIADTSDIDNQISLGVQARLLTGEQWGFSNVRSYTTAPPSWNGILTRLVVEGPEGAELGFDNDYGDYQPPWYDGQEHRALGFHNDTVASRGSHDVCENAYNFGEISGQANGTWERCMVDNWGQYGVIEAIPQADLWLSDLAIVDASVESSQTVNFSILNRGLAENGAFNVRLYEKQDGLFEPVASLLVEGSNLTSATDFSINAGRQLQGDLRLSIEYPNSQNLECDVENNSVELNYFNVRAEAANGLVVFQSFWVASVNNLLEVPNQMPSTVYAGSEYIYRPGAVGGVGVYQYTLINGPDGAQFNASGELRWPTADVDVGIHSISWQIQDESGSVVSETQEIEVLAYPTNQKPQVLSTPPTDATVGEEYVYQMEIVDPDGDDFTILSHSGQLDENYRLTFTPSLEVYNWVQSRGGYSQPTVEIMDAQGAITVHSWAVNLYLKGENPANYPSIEPVNSSVVIEGETYENQISATNPLDDQLVYSLVQGPLGMSMTSSGVLSWTPDQSHIGSHEVIVRASNSEGFDEYSFFLEVLGKFRIISAPGLISYASESYSYSLEATGDVSHYSLSVAPAGMSIDPLGNISWLPSTADIGSHPILVTVEDGFGNWATQGFELGVYGTDISTNNPPQFTSTPTTRALAELQYSDLINAFDPEGLPVELSLVTAPEGMTLINDVLSWTPALSQIGNHPVVIEASDGRIISTSSFSVQVIEFYTENRSPLISGIPLQNYEVGVLSTDQVSASDLDGDNIIYALDLAPVGMTIDEFGLISWLPDRPQAGIHDVQLSVSDSAGGSSVRTYQVRANLPADETITTLSLINEPTQEAFVGQNYRYRTAGFSAIGGVVDVRLVSGPETMSLTPNVPFEGYVELNWTPDEANCQHDVTLELSDDFGNTAQVTYTIDVYNAPKKLNRFQCALDSEFCAAR